MSAPFGFAYVQARAQARLADLLVEPDWRRLDAERSLSSYLETVRTTGLRPLVARFSGASDVHDLEIGLRAQFRSAVCEAAAWSPAPWRPALQWLAWLPDLPLLQHLADGRAAPGWVARDPQVRAWIGDAGRLAVSVLQATGGTRLRVTPGQNVMPVWQASWRASWPPSRSAVVRPIEALCGSVATQRALLSALRPDAAWDARRAFTARLRRLFHRYLRQPVTLFLYLALVGDTLERLRAALVSRALFIPEAVG
jgi:hypothetical protein